MTGAYHLLTVVCLLLIGLQYVIQLASPTMQSSSRSIVEILHFICLGVATGVFYFIWDVDE